MMDRLADLSYIGYTLDPKSKKLTYKITDWVVRCSGEPCTGREAVYVTEGMVSYACPETSHSAL